MDESNGYEKTLELRNKNETVYPSLIRPMSKTLVSKKQKSI